ncbi:hypothetical protein [Nocardioides humi]|uniref:Uncharacterized protein n=1 Tax=Nocardioides humi TaxID=449461 RepID=A0ABN2A1R8_9ACTN|nr:hypothetical protein [Nocardioides humi]
MDTDPVLDELKKLREGRGLNAGRLSRCPNLVAALGAQDSGTAYDALLAILRQMGDGERVRSLRVDFGVDLEELLKRPPSTKEYDFLGDRRSGYGTVIGRGVKTLSRWSDKTIGELRGRLITDRFNGRVVVTAGVQDRRVTGIEVLCYERDDTNMSNGRAIGHPNPEASSLPLVMCGIPSHWQPLSIQFVVAFLGDDCPTKVWALASESVMNVCFGHQRFELEISEGMARCRIDGPDHDHVYGVWWEW